MKEQAHSDEETPHKLSFSERLANRMSAKGEKHKYLINTFSEHDELSRMPHMLRLYSDLYE